MTNAHLSAIATRAQVLVGERIVRSRRGIVHVLPDSRGPAIRWAILGNQLADWTMIAVGWTCGAILALYTLGLFLLALLGSVR